MSIIIPWNLLELYLLEGEVHVNEYGRTGFEFSGELVKIEGEDLVTAWSNDLSPRFDAIAHGSGTVPKEVMKVSKEFPGLDKDSTSRIKLSI